MIKMNFKEIDLSTKDLFDKYARVFDYENMEACFANLFLWKNSWNIQYTEECDSLILCMCHDKVKPFMLPPMVRDRSVSIKPAIDLMMRFMIQERGYFLLRGVTDITKKKIIEDCGDIFEFEEDRKTEEYIYRTKDLIELPGETYHAKKNHVNKFLKTYDYEYEPYDEKYYDACMTLFYDWANQKGFSKSEMASEEDSLKRALTYYKELGLKGCVIKIDGKVCAYSIGEALNHHMALIHIEKADSSYKGIYQFVNMEFLKRQWTDYPYVNRQEDMGIEGLRKAKESYHPAYLVKKYNCFPRGEGDGNTAVK